MKHKAKISITRPISNTVDDYISVSVHDEDACIQFLNLQIPFASFAEALTGLARTPCTMEFMGLQNVGKKREHKELIITLPDGIRWGAKRKDIAISEGKKQCPKGWVMDEYFSRQNSFFTEDGKDFARTSINRWVEKEDVCQE